MSMSSQRHQILLINVHVSWIYMSAYSTYGGWWGDLQIHRLKDQVSGGSKLDNFTTVKAKLAKEERIQM